MGEMVGYVPANLGSWSWTYRYEICFGRVDINRTLPAEFFRLPRRGGAKINDRIAVESEILDNLLSSVFGILNRCCRRNRPRDAPSSQSHSTAHVSAQRLVHMFNLYFCDLREYVRITNTGVVGPVMQSLPDRCQSTSLRAARRVPKCFMVAPGLDETYRTILGRFHSRSDSVERLSTAQSPDKCRFGRESGPITWGWPVGREFGGAGECEVPEMVRDDGCGGLRVIRTVTISVPLHTITQLVAASIMNPVATHVDSALLLLAEATDGPKCQCSVCTTAESILVIFVLLSVALVCPEWVGAILKGRLLSNFTKPFGLTPKERTLELRTSRVHY